MGITDQKQSCIVLFSSYLAFRASDLNILVSIPPLNYVAKTTKKFRSNDQKQRYCIHPIKWYEIYSDFQKINVKFVLAWHSPCDPLLALGLINLHHNSSVMYYTYIKETSKSASIPVDIQMVHQITIVILKVWFLVFFSFK